MSEIIQISNEEALQVYKDVQGPARRQRSSGASGEDFKIICEILDRFGVQIIDDIERNVS